VRASVERRALDSEEIATLLEAARGTRVEVPIRIALATGLRQGELLALRWDDVDLDGGTVLVERSAAYIPGEGVKFGRTKTRNARRTIELSAATVAMLRRHRIDQRQRRLSLGPTWQENGLVFPSTVGTPWTPRNLYRDYKKVVVASGIADPDTVDFHALRHTAATQWIRAGADIHVVSRRLGHASAAFTISVYGHLLRGMQRTAAEALDHLIG
jgi:integrase